MIETIFEMLTYNYEASYLLEGVNEILQQMKKQNNIGKPKCWVKNHELTDIWCVLVGIYGDYGMSPRNGWLEFYKHPTLKKMFENVKRMLENIVKYEKERFE